MTEHMKLSDMPDYCAKAENWLKKRYGEVKGAELWEATGRQYNRYLEELPDYGGKKASHALSIYGSIVVFSMYPLLPDHPPVEELQEFVTDLFMSGFTRLGKVFKAIPHNSKCVDASADFSSDDTKNRRQGTAPVKIFCEV